jgi:hypothetical protein
LFISEKTKLIIINTKAQRKQRVKNIALCFLCAFVFNFVSPLKN